MNLNDLTTKLQNIEIIKPMQKQKPFKKSEKRAVETYLAVVLEIKVF